MVVVIVFGTWYVSDFDFGRNLCVVVVFGGGYVFLMF